MPRGDSVLHRMARQRRAEFLEYLRNLEPEGPCVPWHNAPNKNGYGNLKIDGRQHIAHRWVYEQINGPVERHLQICHSCDNRICVRPGHLWLGTQQDNMHDAAVKGRTYGGNPGATPGEKHPNAKVSDAEVRIIRSLRSQGVRQNIIAETFGISRAQVYRITNGLQRQTAGI